MTGRRAPSNSASVLMRVVLVSSLMAGTVLLYPMGVLAQDTITWKQTQGPTGGKINVLLLVGEKPSVVYAGTDGGVYVSRDRAVTWRNSSAGLPGALQVRALAVDPATPEILYGGTNAGVYRSSDAGVNWTRADTGFTRNLVLSLAIDPVDSLVIFAGTDRQVFKSSDGGNLWHASSEGLPETSCWSLVVDHATSGVVYVGTDSGVFKTIDGGRQWQRCSKGMPDRLRIQGLAIDRRTPSALYAATEAGVYCSVDSAATWEAHVTGLGQKPVYALAADPNQAGTLYAAVGAEGIWRSANGGRSWEPFSDGIQQLVLALAMNPLRSEEIYAGTGRGVYYSEDGGQQWEPRNEGLVSTNVLLLARVPGRPEILYASTGLDVYKTSDFGQSWIPVNKGFVHPNVRSLAVDPAFPDTLYAGTWDSAVYRSDDGGGSWRLINDGLARDAPILALLVQRAESLPARTKASADRTVGTLWAGTNGAGVFASADGGTTWMAIRDGLADLRVQVLVLASCVACEGAEEGILYAGTSGGIYHLNLAGASEPNALLWEPAQGGLPRDEVKSIVVDERSPKVVYAATSTGAGELYRSDDAGTTWMAIGRGSLPTSINVQALALDSSSRRTNLLYAGTDGGIFRSDDGGMSWRAINAGLPPRAHVSGLAFDPNRSYLYASVSNSGVYRASDVEKGLVSFPLAPMVVIATAVVASGLFLAGRWFLRSSARMQDQILERNWPLWKEDVRRILQSQNQVSTDALVQVPAALRVRTLQRYVQMHWDDNLVLRLPAEATRSKSSLPVLEPANSLQVWDFLRNWHAAQQRLSSASAFRPVALRITEQLCQLLGFALIDSRSYKDLHGFVIKAPALRLRLPPTFPVVFSQRRQLAEQDISDIRDLMGILNVSSYLALLVLPDDGPSASQEHEMRTRFQRLASSAADDFVLVDFGDLYRIFVAKDPERRFVGILLGQVDLTVVSPYVTAGPVPENMFFGRDYELKTISRKIKDNNFAIVGGRKIGKTSILTKLNRLFTDSADYCPLYLDCQAVQNYRDFCDAVETMWRPAVPSIVNSAPDGCPESFMRWIVGLKQQREGKLIVILLDEVDALLKYDAGNQERLFRVFRALYQEGCCRFVFCGERVLHSCLHNAGSTFFNFCNVIRLSYLTARDTGRIILEPMQEMGTTFEDPSRTVQKVIELSACHPNIVQYICQQLVALINQRMDRFVTLADLDAIGNSNQFNEYLIEVMWGDATPLERLITLLILHKPGATLSQITEALREQGVVVPTAAIEHALDGLLLCCVLDRDQQEYRIMASAFSAAIAATQEVASLLERMAEEVRAEVSPSYP